MNYLHFALFFFQNTALLNLVFFQMPQHESKDKKMKFFTSGSVAMDVKLEKTGYAQGETFESINILKSYVKSCLKFTTHFLRRGVKSYCLH